MALFEKEPPMTHDVQPWREHFAALVNDYQQAFGDQAGEPAALMLPEDGEVSLHASWRGVEFKLLHSTTSSPAHLFVRCDFGAVPAQDVQAVLLRLLQIQRTLTPSAASMLGIDAADGQVSHVQVLPVDAGLHQLLTTMEEMMLRANEWRASYFLDEDEGEHDAEVEFDQAPLEPSSRMH